MARTTIKTLRILVDNLNDIAGTPREAYRQGADGQLENFPRLGYVVVCASLITLFFMYRIHRRIPEKPVAI